MGIKKKKSLSQQRRLLVKTYQRLPPAVKSVEIERGQKEPNIMSDAFEYQVAFSFAGENRPYVEKVGEILKERDVKVFYDFFEQANLWGKSLPEHLDDVYRKKAAYCVVFISKFYAEKAWTRHERKSVLARAVEQKGEYILPARFDDTDIPGIPTSIGHIDLTRKTPGEFADIIMQKLNGHAGFIKPQDPVANVRKPKTPKSFNPYEEIDRLVAFLSSEIKRRCDASDLAFSRFEREGKVCFRVLHEGEVVHSFDISRGYFSNDAGLAFSSTHGESHSSGFNAFGEFAWDKHADEILLNIQNLSLFGQYGSGETKYSQGDFLEALWNDICDAVERHRE